MTLLRLELTQAYNRLIDGIILKVLDKQNEVNQASIRELIRSHNTSTHNILYLSGKRLSLNTNLPQYKKETVDCLPQFHEEFQQLYKQMQLISGDSYFTASFLSKIINNCENVVDLFYILPEEILLSCRVDKPTSEVSISLLAKCFKKENQDEINRLKVIYLKGKLLR